MQCQQMPGAGAFGRAELGRSYRPGRRLALAALAKMKYKSNIAQNHARKSAWTNIDHDRLYTQPEYNPGRQVGPIKLQPLPGTPQAPPYSLSPPLSLPGHTSGVNLASSVVGRLGPQPMRLHGTSFAPLPRAGCLYGAPLHEARDPDAPAPSPRV
jgi:hypothetical protein